MYNIAVILAGGLGRRIGGNTPKQLLPLHDGRSVLEHAIDAFEKAVAINEILLVMHPEWIVQAETIVQSNYWTKLKHIISGGEERWESSVNAINHITAHMPSIDAQKINIWLHDCARPFVSQRILADIDKQLEYNLAVTVAIPSTDTIYITDQPFESVNIPLIKQMPDRKRVLRAQTPQAFRLPIIQQAYQKAIEKGQIETTDDVSVVYHFMPELQVAIVRGEEANRKITYKEDILA